MDQRVALADDHVDRPLLHGKMARKHGQGLHAARPATQPHNFPLADFTNPAAKAYWQDGVAKLLKIGVAGFKMDRSEEASPKRPIKVFDGRSIRENRNAYPVMYLKGAYDVARKYRPHDDSC